MTRILSAALAAAVACGCTYRDIQGEGPPPAPPMTQTTAMAAVEVGGRLKLYVPLQAGSQPQGAIAIVDAGRTGAGPAVPARIGTIDLSRGTGDTDFASAIAGDASGLVAVGITFPKVWFIDPVTDQVTSVLTLPATYGTSSFSGRTPFITGVIVDAARRRAYLGVFDGFAVVDLDRKAIVDHVAAPPSESFGYDAARHRLIAPFYNCALAAAGPGGQVFPCDSVRAPDGTTVITDGVSLVDLDAGAVYTLHVAGAADPAAPLGPTPDSAAIDPLSGFAVVAVEGTGEHAWLDMGHAVLDPARHAFTVPPVSAIPGAPLTGVAFLPDGSRAFALEESTDLVAAYGHAVGPLVRGRMPALPGAVPWVNGADPHTLTAARLGGRAHGFAVSDDRAWVARIDLDAFLSLPHAGAELTAAELAPAVTFLDARTSP